MAAPVLNMASTIRCDVLAPSLHGGTVAKASTAKLTVNTARVLPNVVQPAIGGPNGLGAVTGCTNAPPPPSKAPCQRVATILPVGVATKLTVQGVGVLLNTLKGTTVGTPPGTLTATANQTRLTAI
jgi:hypothetical protein